MKIKPIEEIKACVEKYAVETGVSIYDIEFKNTDVPTLTFFIEKEGGVDLDTCEKFSRAIDVAIDELDPTYGEPYSLTVSSVGIDKPFKTKEDFEKHLNTEVEVKLSKGIKGKKFYEGIMTYFDDDIVRIKSGKDTLTIDRKIITKINEAIKFD